MLETDMASEDIVTWDRGQDTPDSAAAGEIVTSQWHRWGKNPGPIASIILDLITFLSTSDGLSFSLLTIFNFSQLGSTNIWPDFLWGFQNKNPAPRLPYDVWRSECW